MVTRNVSRFLFQRGDRDVSRCQVLRDDTLAVGLNVSLWVPGYIASQAGISGGHPQHTQGIHLRLVQCWSIDLDRGTALD